MNHILGIGKSALNSIQNKMDAVSDDLSNANTSGYKRKEISFGELLLNEIVDNDVLLSDNVEDAAISAGSKSSVGTVNFKQGILTPTSGEFHIAVEGRGFFGVRDEEGNLMLTRNGGFHRNENGTISDDSGLPLDIEETFPINQWPSNNITISNNGEISANVDDNRILLGSIPLYYPENADSLIPLGEGRYLPSNIVPLYNSIEQPQLFGNINQYTLESSNVDTVKSMVEMITVQRAYSMNTKVVQSTDDIMGIINNIKQ